MRSAFNQYCKVRRESVSPGGMPKHVAVAYQTGWQSRLIAWLKPGLTAWLKPRESGGALRVAAAGTTILFFIMVFWALLKEHQSGDSLSMHGSSKAERAAAWEDLLHDPKAEGLRTKFGSMLPANTSTTVLPSPPPSPEEMFELLDGQLGDAYTPKPAPTPEFPNSSTSFKRDWVNASKYLTLGGVKKEKQDRLKALRSYVSSSEFQARTASLREAGSRGILINAGGQQLVANLIISLKVIRQLHQCDLPVEVAWHGRHEMDSKTWYNLQKQYGPLRGFDVHTAKNPSKGLYATTQLEKYTAKVYSLLLSNFSEVLMLDADNIPVQHPATWFSHPEYLANGNLFWPDAWMGKTSSRFYNLFGISKDAVKILAQGTGFGVRDTESGQLIIDRSRHLDVLEFTYFINTYSRQIKDVTWGDKDTFGAGFALAEKAHEFSQVPVPPSGLFKWRKDMLLIKETQQKTYGWQLMGFLQNDNWGRPAFLHRTINKFQPKDAPWPIELITAPMTRRWTQYYLQHDNLGPTRGVPYDYVVPAASLTVLSLTPTWNSVALVSGSLKNDASQLGQSIAPGCPAATFLSYWQMQEACLPIGRNEELEKLCQPLLEAVLGADLENYTKMGLLTAPQMRYLDQAHLTDGAIVSSDGKGAESLAAWKPDWRHVLTPSPLSQAVQASYQAQASLGDPKTQEQFPILAGKGGPAVRLPDADPELLEEQLEAEIEEEKKRERVAAADRAWALEEAAGVHFTEDYFQDYDHLPEMQLTVAAKSGDVDVKSKKLHFSRIFGKPESGSGPGLGQGYKLRQAARSSGAKDGESGGSGDTSDSGQIKSREKSTKTSGHLIRGG